MFWKMLSIQWKWTKGAAFIATLVGFLIPILSVRAIRTEFGSSALGVVMTMQAFGMGYALLAGGTGLTFAVFAWSQDHRVRHTYALSLPMRRSRYATYRFGAGALFLLLPATAVLIGCYTALSMAPAITGLHAYPIALTLRFLFASGVAYAVFFAIAASTPRTAGMVLGGIALVFVVISFLSAVGVRIDLLGQLGTLLFVSPGLMAVFTGRWMLIDV